MRLRCPDSSTILGVERFEAAYIYENYVDRCLLLRAEDKRHGRLAREITDYMASEKAARRKS